MEHTKNMTKRTGKMVMGAVYDEKYQERSISSLMFFL